jgi:hypothetical protein
MLTTLATLKSRLVILDTDTQYDALLTATIKAISARFDHETNRTLARTENATFEFDPGDTEISVPCYPIEIVTRFESKTSETTGWQEITPAPDYLLRSACIISLQTPLFPALLSPLSALRVVYTGGYLLPGSPPPDPPVPGCQALPDDLEQAAVEQCAYWFQKRDLLGVKTTWPKDGIYRQFADLDLLSSVTATLKCHTRFTL